VQLAVEAQALELYPAIRVMLDFWNGIGSFDHATEYRIRRVGGVPGGRKPVTTGRATYTAIRGGRERDH
jgi:hypothetical protein